MRSLTAAFLVLLPLASHAEVLCQATQNGRVLREVTLFDGPPSELASLVPDQRGQRDTWDVAAIRQAGRRGYLVCGYDRTAQKVEVEIPAAARRCTTTRAPGNRSFGTVECR